MSAVNRLVEEATEMNAQEFLKTISRAAQILSTEKDRCEKLKIFGRLVRMPPLGEAIVVGDLHGDLESLKHILTEAQFVEKASGGREAYVVFLGDYGDRGPCSPEVYYVVLNLKSMFPDRVVLLQGNHEGPEDLMASPHDLPSYLQTRFGTEWHTVYKELSTLFRRFHTAVLVEKRCIMLHGGIPSRVQSLNDLALASEKHPAERHLEEILWSDPQDGVTGTHTSPRGAGNIFGEDVTTEFLKMLKVPFAVRGHQPTNEGYRISHGGKILTLFSRKGPPYCNRFGAYLAMNLGEVYDSAWQLESFIHKF